MPLFLLRYIFLSFVASADFADAQLFINSTTNGTSSLPSSSSLLFSLPTNSTQSATSSPGSSFNDTSTPADPVTLSAIGTTGAYPTYANQTGYWNATTANNNSAPSTASYVSGSAAVWSCGVAWGDYMSAAGDSILSEAGLIPVLETLSWTQNVTVYETYTLCDGIPRVNLSGSTFTTTYLTSELALVNLTGITWTTEEATSIIEPTPIVITVTQTVTTTIITSLSFGPAMTPPPIPTPTCNIAPADCVWLLSESSNALWTGGSLNLSAVPSVWCEDEVTTFSSCMLIVPTVQLMYWPVTLASQDLCHYPFPIDITASPNISTIRTAVAFGQTFTSDENCYLSYAPITARELVDNGLSYSVITSLPGGILTVPSSELQSFRGLAPGAVTNAALSFNFADLPPNHVPLLAYEAALTCDVYLLDAITLVYPWCLTINEGQYAPILVYPTQFLELDPIFSTCGFDFAGVYDPPTALVPVGSLETTPAADDNAAPTTTADPGSSAYPVTPPPTTASFVQLPVSLVVPPGGSGVPAEDSGAGSGPGDSGVNDIQGLGSGDLAFMSSGGGSNGNGNSGSGSGGVPALEDNDPPANGLPTGAIITLGNNGPTVTASANGQSIVVAGQAITPGGSAATVGGNVISAARGSSLVIADANGDVASTVALSQIPAAAVYTGAVLTLLDGDTTVTASADGNGGIVVLGKIIQPGGPAVTVGNDIISAISGHSIVIASGNDPTTIALSQIAGSIFDAQVQVSTVAMVTLGSEIVTVLQSSNGAVIIGGTTLSQGQIATIHGQTVAVACGGTAIVVRQSSLTITIPVSPATTNALDPGTSTILSSSGSTKDPNAMITSQNSGSNSVEVSLVATFGAFFVGVGLLNAVV